MMAAAIAGSALFMSSCNDDDATDQGTAYLAVRMTDTTANYDSVMIDIQSVEVKGDGGTVLLNANAGMYNLLDFTNGKDTLIASADIPSGHVSQVRLILGTNNYVVIDGVRYNLATPSAQQSGLKLNLQTTLTAGVNYTLLLDFDASRSIVTMGNGSYSLKPVIRVVSIAASGSIAGTLGPADALPALATATNGTDTITTFTDSAGHFLFRGVPAGSYTLILVPQLPYIPDTVHAVSVSVGSMTDVGLINF